MPAGRVNWACVPVPFAMPFVPPASVETVPVAITILRIAKFAAVRHVEVRAVGRDAAPTVSSAPIGSMNCEVRGRADTFAVAGDVRSRRQSSSRHRWRWSPCGSPGRRDRGRTDRLPPAPCPREYRTSPGPSGRPPAEGRRRSDMAYRPGCSSVAVATSNLRIVLLSVLSKPMSARNALPASSSATAKGAVNRATLRGPSMRWSFDGSPTPPSRPCCRAGCGGPCCRRWRRARRTASWR